MNTSEFMRLIGQRVREKRMALVLSQEGLAQAAGLHRTQINLIEQNRRKIRIETLLRLAIALQTEPADLLPGLAEVNGHVQQSEKPSRRRKARRALPRSAGVPGSRDQTRHR